VDIYQAQTEKNPNGKWKTICLEFATKILRKAECYGTDENELVTSSDVFQKIKMAGHKTLENLSRPEGNV